jgi:glycine/D-amino acid oxidase-like deaminating enzyme
MDAVPAPMINDLLGQINADPQLPRPNPTSAFWQLPPHATISQIQSASPPQSADYVIIGSGITACSIATHLFTHPDFPKSARVTILEARTLCSGATGRNGGALTSWVPLAFTDLIAQYGQEEAIKIGRYAVRTLNKMHDLGNSRPEYREASEVRRLRDVLAFVDAEAFEVAKLSFQKYEDLIGKEYSLNSEVLSARETHEQYNMTNVAGALLVECGAYWPYRLITALWADLLKTHSQQLTIETNTPAQSITYDSNTSTYTITTPTRTITTPNVIHATNGYTGHLLPALRGKIHPLRGTMSTQHPPLGFGHYGTERAWSISHAPRYDPETKEFEAGLYYANQNPKSQDVFIGGEKVLLTEIFVSDDTEVREEARRNIEGILPRYFDKKGLTKEKQEQEPEIRRVWSGIMGFTSDGMPFVGKVPRSISQRKPDSSEVGSGGEWIAAGFNGYGMPQCWSAGEAVAKMILGKYESEVKDWLPDACLITEQRLAKMSAEASLAHLTGIKVRRC